MAIAVLVVGRGVGCGGASLAEEPARRADDRRAISGIFYVLKSGCWWVDCPDDYGPMTTIYNRFNCWSARGFSGSTMAPSSSRKRSTAGPARTASRSTSAGLAGPRTTRLWRRSTAACEMNAGEHPLVPVAGGCPGSRLRLGDGTTTRAVLTHRLAEPPKVPAMRSIDGRAVEVG